MSDRTNRQWSEDDLASFIKLHLAIDYPSLEDCYLHGYLMAQRGHAEDENPYQQCEHKAALSDNASYWEQGWWDGFYEQESAFEIPADAEMLYLDQEAPTQPSEEHPQTAANDADFQSPATNLLSTVAKFAAAVAGAILSYQVIDLIA